MELHCTAPCLLLVFPAALLVTSGGWIRVFILLCCLALAYITIKSTADKLKFCVHSALQSPLGFGSSLVDLISNYTLGFVSSESPAMEEIREDTLQRFLSLPFTSPSFPGARELVTTAPENLDYPWDVQTSVLPLLPVVKAFQIKQSFKNITERSAPRQDSSAWKECGTVWAGAWSGGHPQGFGTSSPSNCRMLRTW